VQDVLVRRATPADAEAITDGNLAMAWETERRRLARETVRAGVERALADERKGVYFVAESEGGVVGQLMVTLEWSDWRDGWFWWVQSVYVRADRRGAGVYAALEDHVLRTATADPEVRGLRLYVEAENELARRVYARRGWDETTYRLYERDWSRT